MKLKYRTFDDTVYKEIECDYLKFYNNTEKKEKTYLLMVGEDEYGAFIKEIENVCEVYIEEI